MSDVAAALILVQAFRGVRLDGALVDRRGDPADQPGTPEL